ncbi:hypothetical protein GCM10027445_25360 [Amycolatopsis endophytica]|uniref:AcrR family transcriptional regulator n=1 Tax=Amycolatopsis endophytica TaxID=860233 RepID=A0A853BC94_9PSEU|nr:TetR/AcrR family transcriptional regulator [Amycolatopsis endophytica]NYI92372.1 AcrR family transcriptional regulator [Amycolatopsis endophytica]
MQIDNRRMTRRRRETRERLIDAAYAVFTENGIRAARIEQICDRAGYTRGAFYSNFASKEDLFLAVYEQEMDARRDRLAKAIEDILAVEPPDRVADVPPLLARIAVLFMDNLVADEDWYLLNAEFFAEALRRVDLRESADAAQGRFHDDLARILDDALARLGMRLLVDARDAVQVIVSLYQTALERALFEGIARPEDNRYVTDILPRALSGLIAPAGETPAP